METPLHPAYVHLPLGIAFVLPLVTLVALFLSRRASAAAVWVLPVMLFFFLAVGAFLSVESGEREEDAVEPVVGEPALHEHEEAAEGFHLAAWVAVGLAAAGFLPGGLGRALKVVSVAAAIALLGLGLQVGKLGGALVWEHGAASAYSIGASLGGADGELARPEGSEGESESDDE